MKVIDMLSHDLTLMAPEIFCAAMVLVLTILGAIRGDRSLSFVLFLAAVSCVLTIAELATNASYWDRAVLFNGMFVVDAFATTVKIFCLSGMTLLFIMMGGALRADQMARFEFPILVMISGIGMMIMASSNHFLTMYMGVELSALALYVLAAFRRDSVLSSEAGMKYFVLGALSSGMLLFGVSLIYGFTGSLSFDVVHTVMVSATPAQSMGAIVGMAFILAGLAFKISAVPFHMWTPDVYQGSPGVVTAFFASVPKIAALALTIRVLMYPFAALSDDWVQIVAFLALASMVWGAFAAVSQSNIKRLLAYGSIGNMGYALMGVLTGTPEGLSAALMYIGIYMIMTIGVFAVLLAVRRKDDGTMIEEISDFAGLSRTHPIAAYLLAVMMFSMAGIPPLAGFFGKLMVFQAVVSSGYIAIAVVGVLTSVIAAYYYLRVIRVMFFDPIHTGVRGNLDIGQQVSALVCVVAVLAFVFAPGVVYSGATRAVNGLTSGVEQSLAAAAASIMPAAGGATDEYPPMPESIPNGVAQ